MVRQSVVDRTGKEEAIVVGAAFGRQPDGPAFEVSGQQVTVQASRGTPEEPTPPSRAFHERGARVALVLMAGRWRTRELWGGTEGVEVSDISFVKQSECESAAPHVCVRDVEAERLPLHPRTPRLIDAPAQTGNVVPLDRRRIEIHPTRVAHPVSQRLRRSADDVEDDRTGAFEALIDGTGHLVHRAAADGVVSAVP